MFLYSIKGEISVKKWIAAALALLVVLNLGVLRVDAVKTADTEPQAIIDAVVVAPDLDHRYGDHR